MSEISTLIKQNIKILQDLSQETERVKRTGDSLKQTNGPFPDRPTPQKQEIQTSFSVLCDRLIELEAQLEGLKESVSTTKGEFNQRQASPPGSSSHIADINTAPEAAIGEASTSMNQPQPTSQVKRYFL